MARVPARIAGDEARNLRLKTGKAGARIFQGGRRMLRLRENEKPMADWKMDLQIYESGLKIQRISKKSPAPVVARKLFGNCQVILTSIEPLISEAFRI